MNQMTTTCSLLPEINDIGKQVEIDNAEITKVLIIGGTGTGKSTFINCLTNYFRNGTLDKLEVAIPSRNCQTTTEEFQSAERCINDQSKSQTRECLQYLFKHQENDKLYMFLDTPGLGDTGGLEVDEINIKKIIDAVLQLGSLTTVIIMENGTNPRLNINTRNILTQLWGNLPDSVMETVIVILTNVKSHDVNFNLDLLNLHGSTVHVFYINNSAFSQPANEWTEQMLTDLKADWENSMSQIKNILETIDTLTAKSVHDFKTMRQIRGSLKSIIHEIRLEINNIQTVQEKLAVYEKAVEKYAKESELFQDYTRETTITRKEIKLTRYNNTLCAKCSYVCHKKCSFNETTIRGDQIFQCCYAITKENTSRECPGHCSFLEHYHDRKTIEVVTETQQEILHEIKARYDFAVQKKKHFELQITTIEQAKELLENALEQKLTEIKEVCVELKSVCKNFDLKNEIFSLIQQLKLEINQLSGVEVKEQAKKLIGNLTAFYDHIKTTDENKEDRPPMQLIKHSISQKQPPETQADSSLSITSISVETKKVQTAIDILDEIIKKREASKATDTNSTTESSDQPNVSAFRSMTISLPPSSISQPTPYSSTGAPSVNSMQPSSSDIKLSEFQIELPSPQMSKNNFSANGISDKYECDDDEDESSEVEYDDDDDESSEFEYDDDIPNTDSICVSNLPNNVHWTQIHNVFSKFGEIQKTQHRKNRRYDWWWSIYICDDTRKNNGTCIAFITFVDQRSVDGAIRTYDRCVIKEIDRRRVVNIRLSKASWNRT